jgi:hypothetical protein
LFTQVQEEKENVESLAVLTPPDPSINNDQTKPVVCHDREAKQVPRADRGHRRPDPNRYTAGMIYRCTARGR